MTVSPFGAMQMELELPGVARRVEAAATKPAVASRSEIGYAQASLSQWWLFDEGETTPELQWPRSIAVYDQMRRTDAQVTSLFEAVTLPIRRTPWRLNPAGARANVVKFVANDLGLPIVGKGPAKAPARTKGKFSWPDHLRLALLELIFGHMFFEQVYSVNDAGTEAHLKKLAPRMPSTIDEISVAPDGGLNWIKQRWTSGDSAPQEIPVSRLVAYVRNREGGNWLGQSILRPAYKNWLLKDRLLRVQAQTIERNGMGIPVYEGQENASPADLAAGKAMATAWRSGEAAGSATPFGAKIRLVGVEGTLPDADPAIRYHDEQIARAALAHFLNLGTQTGSWALGATFADFFVYSLQTLAQQIADVTTQHVIEDLVDLNFGEDEPAPKLVFDEIGSQQAATAQALKTLVDAGIIHPDQVLEESSRQQYGLPPADPATAAPPPGQASPTPPEPTAMGDLSVAAARRPRPGRPARRSVRARYNPAQKRDPNGTWGDGMPGPGVADFTDGLGIDELIPVEPGDRLGSNGRVGDRAGDADLNWAVVFSKEYGPEVRIGVTSGEDSNAWKGDWEAGGTAILDTETVSKLRTRLTAGVEEAGRAARDADTAWRSGTAPTDPKLLGTDPVASGEALGGGDTADVAWGIYLTDDEPTSWQLEVSTSPDSGGVRYGPKGAAVLLRELDRIEGELRGPLPPDEVMARHRYNPDQLRDPGGDGGGRWVKAPGAVVHEVISTAGGDLSVSGDSGGIRLRFGDSDSGPLDDGAATELIDELGEVGSDTGGRYPRVGSVASHAGGAPVAYAGVRRTDQHSAHLELFSNDAELQLTARDADAAGSALIRALHAKRIETQAGPVDVWPADRDDGVLRVPNAGGGSTEVHLSEEQALSLESAITTAARGRSGSVQTSAGAIKVRHVGETSDGQMIELIGPGGRWQVTLPAGAAGDAAQTLNGGLGRFDEWRGGAPDSVTAAGGVDTHPGGEELKHWWVYGEGAAKWKTFTELYQHLRKHLAEGMAKRTAAAWFHLRFGFWPGDHRNVHASAELTNDEAAEWEEGIDAIVAALAELSGEVQAAAFDEARHPRGPGGKFRSTVDKLKSAIEVHRSGGGKGDPFEGFDREQLRRAAKTRGITLGRGEDRDSIAKKLLDDLGGKQPAPVEAPKPKRAPRKTAPAEVAPLEQPEPAPKKRAPRKRAAPKAKPAAETPPSRPGTTDRDALASTVSDHQVKAEKALSGGLVGDTRLRTYDDGSKTVWKKSKDFDGVLTAKHQADAEELAPLVAHALGLNAPAVVRADESTVHMAYVDNAKSTAEIQRWDDSIPASDAGRMLGLLDVLIDNTDRNRGNVLRPDDGGPIVPIDHGLAFREVSPAASPSRGLISPYTDAYMKAWDETWVDNDLTPSDIAEARRRLDRLKPEFDRVGHPDWLTFAMGRLDALEPYAKGTTNRLLPEVR